MTATGPSVARYARAVHRPRRGAPRRPRVRDRLWRIDALVLGLVAVVLRLPALFATRSLVFDDGVFASAALAMRAASTTVPRRLLEPGTGVPAAPVDRRPRRVPHPRRAAAARPCASGVVLDRSRRTRALAASPTRAHALLAAGLVTTSGSVLWVTGPVNADGPSMALSVLAIALALPALDRVEPRPWDAVWAGLAGGAAVVDQGDVGTRRRRRRPGTAPAVAPRAVTPRSRQRWPVGVVRSQPRCHGASTGCGTSRSRTTTTPAV